MIMPGQCLSIPSFRRANLSGSEEGVWSSLRTWAWTIVAPASKASCVDSTCSDTVIGTAGLLALVGRLPVMATQMMQGVVILGTFRCGRGQAADAARDGWIWASASTKKGRKPWGCSLIGKWPSSSITASVAPGMARAVRAASSGVQVRS
jgi:hypothetical protein